MPEFLRSLLDTFGLFEPRSLLDIALIAGGIFWLLLWLRGTSAMSLVRGIAIVVAVGVVLGNLFDLTVVNWLLRNSLTALLVALPIIFQPEIRRALERVGRTGIRSWRSRVPQAGVHQTLATAAAQCASLGHGALIVLERETGLEDYVETGVRLDALPTAPLLSSIFYPNAALHDGAVIVREGRIAAAGCTLPLAEPDLRAPLGTRHRAALGISERTDAMAIVVSEETGEVSLAVGGRLVRPLGESKLLQLLDGEIGVTPLWPLPNDVPSVDSRLVDGRLQERSPADGAMAPP